jgi:PAS domain S-box-containing protein
MKYNTSRNILVSAVLIFCLSALTIFALEHKDILTHESHMQAHLLNSNNDHVEKYSENHKNGETLLIVKPDRNLSYVSDEIVEKHGFSKTELINKNVLTFVHPKDLPELSYQLIEYHKKLEKVENIGPVRIKMKSGEFKSYLVSLTPELNENKELKETVVILKDVSSPLGDIEGEHAMNTNEGVISQIKNLL